MISKKSKPVYPRIAHSIDAENMECHILGDINCNVGESLRIKKLLIAIGVQCCGIASQSSCGGQILCKVLKRVTLANFYLIVKFFIVTHLT